VSRPKLRQTDGEDLGPQRSYDAELTIAVGHETRSGEWRVIVALRPAVDIPAGHLVTRDLGDDEIAPLIAGIEAAQAEARRSARIS
jgi:hypothetical protein